MNPRLPLAAACLALACNGDTTGPAVEKSGPFATISAGLYSCGLTPVGAAYCWGDGDTLADGTRDRVTPTRVSMPTGMTFTSVSVGARSCALTQAGTAYCWVGNVAPVAVAMPPGETFSTLVVGGYHTCALTPQGLAYCWGGNTDGQIGDGTKTDRPTPVPVVMPDSETFASLGLSIGIYNHTCGLTPAGAAYCWGANFSGQLGDSTTTDSPSAVPVAMPPGETFASLAVGGYHTCALTPAGAAYCWGYNGRGRLGDGTITDRWIPTPVLMPSGVTFTQLAAGVDNTCGLTPVGAAYCWGRNVFGQVGDGTITFERLEPVAVVMPTNVTFASLVAGWDYACALTATGEAYCWGYNGQGRLGDGTETDRPLPVKVVQS